MLLHILIPDIVESTMYSEISNKNGSHITNTAIKVPIVFDIALYSFHISSLNIQRNPHLSK